MSEEFNFTDPEPTNYIELTRSEQALMIKLLMDSESQADGEYNLLLKLMVIYQRGIQ